MRAGLAAIVAHATLAAMPTPDATPPDSSHKLAHVLVLDDGTKLVTLRDAANVLTDGVLTVEQTAAVVSLSGGALFANVVSVVLLVVETVSFQRR